MSRVGGLIAIVCALAVAAPVASATQLLPPPKPSGVGMQWYRWDPSSDALRVRAAAFGPTAVVGLEAMRDLSSLRDKYGFRQVRAIPELHAAEVQVGRAQLRALLAKAPSDRRIRYVSPPGPPRRMLSVPNDPFVRGVSRVGQEWQFWRSRVDRALDFSQGDPRIAVGVIDSGIVEVPDLAGKIDGMWAFADDGITPTLVPRSEFADGFGHGTAVASLIAANVNDAFGMAGFGGATHLIAFRACPDGYCTDFQIARALTTLTSLGVRIVNISQGGPTPDEAPLVDAIHKAAADGVLIVAAAGNRKAGLQPRDGVYFPAADLQPSGGGRSYGLAVGASANDASVRPADFSNPGRHLSLLAPGAQPPIYADIFGRRPSRCGTGVLVALPPTSPFMGSCESTAYSLRGGRYGFVAGTSFAAPEVAGIAALIWAARPELTNYQVADIIKESARNDLPSWTPVQGCGTLDAGAALELATSRPASAWTSSGTGSTACSAGGDQPATWPSEKHQTITFKPLADKTLRDPDFAVRATASSRLPVFWFEASGACTIDRATIHLERVGTCTLTASQDGNLKYNAAPNVMRSFTIASRRRHR